jgi:hypothetical protein
MTDDTPCGWCGHRWDLHNHVTDECLAALASGLDACECPGWEAPVWSSDEYDRAMEWLDSIDPADVRPVDDATRDRIRQAVDDATRSRQAAVDRRLREREELIALIAYEMDGSQIGVTCQRAADSILAAGWRK